MNGIACSKLKTESNARLSVRVGMACALSSTSQPLRVPRRPALISTILANRDLRASFRVTYSCIDMNAVINCINVNTAASILLCPVFIYATFYQPVSVIFVNGDNRPFDIRAVKDTNSA